MGRSSGRDAGRTACSTPDRWIYRAPPVAIAAPVESECAGVKHGQQSRLESLPYPSGLTKWLLKSPILLYRLGLGFVVGRIFMVMTTLGRKSGQPRQTAIEFYEFRGRNYVFSAWGKKADWLQNIQANPLVTIQTWRGAQSVTARRLTTDAELAEAFEYAIANPSMRAVLKSVGFALTLEQFIAQKERLVFVTFDPTDQPTPEPIRIDLWWVWLAVIAVILSIFITTW